MAYTNTTSVDRTRIRLFGKEHYLPKNTAPKKDEKATDILAQVGQEQQDYYNSVFRPEAQRLINDVNSTAIVDSAKAAAGVDRTEANRARALRQRQRLGVSLTARDQDMQQYQQRLGDVVTNDGNVNNAYVAQQERNDSTRAELVNIGRGITTSSINGLTTAASNQNARDMNNANIQHQNNVAEKQQTAAIVSMLAMMIL